ncbi:MAG TPA: short-chain dehydrogenase, partial [Alphaproteobacteria bacterium]|nr:short-chain dehydrogenase [Alphaproteobacteria bacterium]
MLDFGIAGKTAVVCASSKGLGFGCADALGAVGTRLVMNGRTPETLAAAAERIRQAHGVEVIEVASDITTEEGRAAVLEAAGHV